MFCYFFPNRNLLKLNLTGFENLLGFGLFGQAYYFKSNLKNDFIFIIHNAVLQFHVELFFLRQYPLIL